MPIVLIIAMSIFMLIHGWICHDLLDIVKKDHRWLSIFIFCWMLLGFVIATNGIHNQILILRGD